MLRSLVLALLLSALGACQASPTAPADPLAEVPQEPYAPAAGKQPLHTGQLLVRCDTQLTVWQMAMGAERSQENLETINFTERSIATLVHENEEELRRLAVSGDPRSRAIALSALAFSPDDGVLELILSNVGHEDEMLAANAMLAVGIHASPETPLSPIHEAVMAPDTPDMVMRNAAFACLRLARAQREEPDPFLAATMIPMLRHHLSSVRAQATAGLGIVRAAHAVPFLVRRLEEDTTARVRTTAAWSLGEIGDRSATQALAWALDDINGYVSGAARAALKKLYGEDRGASPEDWISDLKQ